ncbi:CHAP domain-containing protein [Actinacidiphila bryophytorum]|uniref:CHAP domain-containing protein n=1 Tax=Actinacidiphila bryophytorum TaxID=1436133 RepID=A0A9W4MHQ7_9ACTN|nr:CHAP domain-containing protein [Actinacidiphila bryophytorum]MBM9440183.1 CHAP domain-containing protein [Actinacidiphila bryophytorum]MBN6541843.1 CHAP domain-containing protein [Actinacidiphila bryophytorum]CAG7645097.1 exported hypothetical protein [Actinacidiphila bryophytorum]
MLRTSRILSAAVVAAALAVPLGVMPAAQAAGSAGPGPAAHTASAPARHTMTVDGVALTVANPGMPVGATFAARPGDSVQSASAEATGPFRFFSVTAVPFGERLPKSDFPVARSGGAAGWRSVGGASAAGPVATLFGQKVTGQVRHETDGASRLLTVQWVVEAGDRIWVVRAEHAEPDVPAGFATGIALASADLAAPTTVDVTAANAGAQPHAEAAATPATSGDPVISFGSLPAPPSSYWNHGGGTCDNSKYGLLNEKIADVQVCGYSNGDDRATGWGSNEWECAELPLRYAIQRWGLTSNDGGDGKDQADNLKAALNAIHPGRFVLRGNALSDHTAPQPGDVISYYDSGAGHTGIVIASHVDSSGNGSIDMVHENWNEVPSTPGEWDGIPVRNGVVENVLGGSGDVHWMHDSAWTPIPPGFGVTIDANGAPAAGQTVSGTVNLTGMASASGYITTGRYVITGPNGYNTGQLTPSAGGASNYPYAWNTAGLAGGTYQISFVAHEIDGQDHTYGPVGVKISAMPRSSSSGLTAMPGGGYTTAWRGADGRLWVGTGSGTNMAQPADPWLLGVAPGTKPSIATLADGSWVTAWVGGDGRLWVGTGSGTNMAQPAEPWLLGVAPGTSPSIVALATGGWEVAWKGGDGRLWLGTGNGTNMAQPAEPWLLGVADTTSPSLAALPNGGYEVAWKGGDGRLWLGTGSGTNMAQPAEPWLLGVGSDGSPSSPSLVILPNGNYEVAWKGGDGRLWLGTGSGTNMAEPAEPWLLGVADTTSPSLAALPGGGYEAAWKGGDGRLWLGTGSGTSMAQPAEPWLLGVDTDGSSSSPSLVTLSDGGYEVAWKGGDGRLWLGNGSGTTMGQPAEPWLLGVG